MTTLFISDLHLCEERPRLNALFTRFLDDIACDAEALYILGDLFEFWIGDDQLDHDPLARAVAKQLARTADRGTRIFFMHGNRDFLISARFAREASLTLLPDPAQLTLGEQRILLMHGDTLCTDDVAYQEFRAQVRDPAWQAEVLAKPYAARAALARTMRSRSDIEKSIKADAIMDVNAEAVAAAFERHQYPVMIHGHTHRPAKHQLTVNGHACTRWVLPDWHAHGGYLSTDGSHNELTAHAI
ncbi:MAG: UDP-2,3-diacylglucosamine diphosphatase [Betaproteobacteria bacterium]|nr:UDP-2,3-diacylglucosamine diphosphatase [Betaproteobacteria bacterium]